MTEAEMRQQGIRTVTDGKPYYCVVCGSGWNEYGACESVACQLEPSWDAAARFVLVEPPTAQIGDYSDIMDEPL